MFNRLVKEDSLHDFALWKSSQVVKVGGRIDVVHEYHIAVKTLVKVMQRSDAVGLCCSPDIPLFLFFIKI